MRTLIILAALLVGLNAAFAAQPQHAPSAALAKKCRELAVKAHPPATAGSKTGTAAAERAYFTTCIKTGGEMDKEGGAKTQ
jgi:hypothetical protein